MSYTKTCESSLFALKKATINKLLPQDIIPPTQYDTADHTGYCALARTLTFQHPCAAVFHNKANNVLSIAFNTHAKPLVSLLPAQKFQYPPTPDILTQYMYFLGDSVKDPVITKNLIGLVVSKSWAYPLFTHPVPGALKNMASYSDVDKACVGALDHIRKVALDSRGHASNTHSTQKFFDLYSELLFKLSESTDNIKEHYADAMLQPLLDITKVHTLFASSTPHCRLLPNQEGHHAELAVLKDLQNTATPVSGVEIGVSKLTCFICHVVFQHREVKTIGTHGKFYFSPTKQLLQDFFADDASCARAVTALNKYIANQPSLKNTIVKNWDDLPKIDGLNLSKDHSMSLPPDAYMLSTRYLLEQEPMQLLGSLGLSHVVSDLLRDSEV